MVKNRQKGITKAYRNDKKDVDTRVIPVTLTFPKGVAWS
jgi:hypothetical protein